MQRPLDPRDRENWLELSKQYDHLKEYSEDGVSAWRVETSSKNTLFSQEKSQWLKGKEGLIALKDTWLAALYIFSKYEGLDWIDSRGWRNCISIVAITDITKSSREAYLELDTTKYPDYWKYLFNRNQGETEKEQWIAYGRDPLNYRVSSEEITWATVTAHIGIRSVEIRKEWEKAKKSFSAIIEKEIWKALVACFPELSIDDPTGQYTDISDMFDDFTTEVSTIGSPRELQNLVGLDFNILFTEILHPKPKIQKRDEGKDVTRSIAKETRPYIDKGRISNPVERSLATFLRSSGYLVILEPQLHLPHPEADTFRNPDLIVIDKGRAIAVEIDDTSHLIDHDNEGKANIRKWKRDRLLDQMMLRSGIPVLRIWHSEAREKPEQVLTKILEVFESLGGSRLRYQ